jgi:nucleoside-diphosphate-sugar epimerase
LSATPESQRVLVTGASGFVGSALCRHFIACGFDVVGTVRSLPATLVPGVDYLIVGELGTDTAWSDKVFTGVKIIVHCAARVHVMNDYAKDPLMEFRRVNTLGTENLAQVAAHAGVKRLIFLSSIKVNGENSLSDTPIDETSPTNPQGHYGISKMEAEKALRRIAAETELEVVILRLPMVYGPGVKGNFLRLLKIVDSGIPLPFSLVNNQRSLIYLNNLTGAITACLTKSAAVGKTYMVSDGENISTPQLITQIAYALEKPVRLWPCPLRLLEVASMLAGKSDEISKLLGSLCINSNKIRSELGWVPSYTLTQGLSVIAAWYHRQV